MLNANEARAIVTELKKQDKMIAYEKAVKLCENEITTAIKEEAQNKGTRITVSIDQSISRNTVMEYLQGQGYTVYTTGFYGLDIRW